MNEIVEKKIHAVETPVKEFYSLKYLTPVFAYIDFIAQNGQNIKWRGIFWNWKILFSLSLWNFERFLAVGELKI